MTEEEDRLFRRWTVSGKRSKGFWNHTFLHCEQTGYQVPNCAPTLGPKPPQG